MPAEAAPVTLDGALVAIDRDRLMAHIAEFAKRVKLSGSAEELASFRYLESEMRRCGYRTELLSHDAYISLPVSSRVVVDGVEIPSITHSMSKPTGGEGIAAPLTYVGQGEAADFDKRDVTGAIVLVDGIAVEDVAERASRAGAIGEIHISPTEHLYEMCISPVWGSPSERTAHQLPTTAAATVSRDDGAALRARCLAGERIVARMTTDVDTGWRKTPLLVCDLDAPGDRDDPFILLSGHHDTWHFGVMDNGGANAVMLETARVLADRRGEWRRGLRVCFWSGHSHGRYSGSAWYADEKWIELERRCAAHVNVDSTGAIGATVLANSGVAEELQGLAREIVADETGQIHAGRRPGRVADQSFWGVGVPSMFGSLSHQPPGPAPALGWWWHTPHDLADKIDPAHLVRDARIVLRALWALLTRPVLPLDYAAYADAMRDEIDSFAPMLRAHLPVDSLRNAVAALKAAAINAATAATSAEASSPEASWARRLDRALMQASRALVPISYTSGERFVHDPAVPLPDWVALEPLRALAKLPAGSPDIPFFAVSARQTLNRVLHAVAQATDRLQEAVRKG